ncbi:Protein of unknown function [Pyronema omphalodes CBS 100304]|uniref:Uncharacterized protein n=1 Tax=Pyronema omphalodes (strain CBS 100304) TaxID=1076935 RepID=U4LGX7_PYROM|nr:Protein of unknown function [Pyronema omphalodes CBS 100304]
MGHLRPGDLPTCSSRGCASIQYTAVAAALPETHYSRPRGYVLFL